MFCLEFWQDDICSFRPVNVALTVSFKLFKKFLTFIVLCCNKIQNGDILVPANPGPPGKWLLNGKRELALIGCGVCVMY